MDAYLDAMVRYFDFSGRASRSQYWLFFLIYMVLMVVAVMADMALGAEGQVQGHGLCVALLTVLHIVPGLSITVRRLHDTGRSGWWYLLAFVPLVGIIVFVWTGFFGSEPGRNDYGDEPSSVTASPAPGTRPRFGRPKGSAEFQDRMARITARPPQTGSRFSV